MRIFHSSREWGRKALQRKLNLRRQKYHQRTKIFRFMAEVLIFALDWSELSGHLHREKRENISH